MCVTRGGLKYPPTPSETLWEFEEGFGKLRNALGASKKFWEAQKRFGSFKKALGGSETLWQL